VAALQQLGEASANGVLLLKMTNGNQQLGHYSNSAERKGGIVIAVPRQHKKKLVF